MSVRFLDGPAKGASLSLARAPVFLRVVIDPAGKVDALDQLDDTPSADEAIHVYRKHEHEASAIVCSRGKGGGCRQMQFATYALYATQPPDATLRDTARWQQWCHALATAEEAEQLRQQAAQATAD